MRTAGLKAPQPMRLLPELRIAIGRNWRQWRRHCRRRCGGNSRRAAASSARFRALATVKARESNTVRCGMTTPELAPRPATPTCADDDDLGLEPVRLELLRHPVRVSARSARSATDDAPHGAGFAGFEEVVSARSNIAAEHHGRPSVVVVGRGMLCRLLKSSTAWLPTSRATFRRILYFVRSAEVLSRSDAADSERCSTASS